MANSPGMTSSKIGEGFYRVTCLLFFFIQILFILVRLLAFASLQGSSQLLGETFERNLITSMRKILKTSSLRLGS